MIGYKQLRTVRETSHERGELLDSLHSRSRSKVPPIGVVDGCKIRNRQSNVNQISALRRSKLSVSQQTAAVPLKNLQLRVFDVGIGRGLFKSERQHAIRRSRSPQSQSSSLANLQSLVWVQSKISTDASIQDLFSHVESKGHVTSNHLHEPCFSRCSTRGISAR